VLFGESKNGGNAGTGAVTQVQAIRGLYRTIRYKLFLLIPPKDGGFHPERIFKNLVILSKWGVLEYESIKLLT